MAAARFRILRHRVDGSMSWRLLATNNRDLGRAPVGYPDAEACQAAVLRLQRDIASLRVVIVRAGPSSWSWRILAGEAVAAVSSRDYQRRIQAEQAATIALDLIPSAELVGLDPRR
ncbi:hypothetical protein ACQPZX_48575 [Actinoplanes sp. CA-142083]|uniref:hypothetical protein n=1 Tax=Actinoplanes sp. CA-142083 TaxID=3239903 RepID=UPI003D940E79